MKKRPWRILSVFDPTDVIGGGVLLAHELIRATRPRRCRYTIGCIQSRRTLSYFRKHGIPAISMGTTRQQLLSRMRAGGFDLVESCRNDPAIARAAQEAGLPFVWRMGVDPSLFLLEPASRCALLAMLNASDRVVVLSDGFVQRINRRYAHKVRVIPAGIDLKLFDPAVCRIKRKHFRKRLGLGADTLAVGMAAHFVPRKRHLDLVTAARFVLEKNPRVQFMLFGDCFPGTQYHFSRLYQLMVEQAIRQFGLSRQIRVHPFHPDRVELHAGLDLLVHPALGEGHPGAILDAMASGKPVIGVRSGGVPDLIAHNCTGYLVAPEQPQALAQAILDLIEHPRRRAAFGGSGQARASRDFDIHQRVKQYETLYSELLEKR